MVSTKEITKEQEGCSMSVKERVLTARLLWSLEQRPEYANHVCEETVDEKKEKTGDILSL